MASVNRPTNTQIKEKDINNKLQLYGIYSAFSNGKVPSNKQIDIALNSALASKPLSAPSPKLSEEGQKLVADLRDVINKAKLLLLTKNEGNVLQDFIWQTQKISGGDAKAPNAPVDKETARQHGDQALEGLRTLGTLILSNGQFRKLLNDATILIRDMAGDAATNTASRVKPSEEQLSQIDAAAEDNTWHEVPDLSRDNIRSQIKASYDKNRPFGKDDVKDAAGNAVDTADQNRQPNGDLDAGAGAAVAANQLKDQASTNVPDETQEKAKQKTSQFRESTRNYLSSKMPQDRREQTIWRLKKMVVEIQGHADYQQAIETLLSLAETYAGHGRDMSTAGAGTVKGAHTDESLKTAETDLKTLIERFANSTSTEDLFDSINTIYRDADKDPELKKWFKSVDGYVRKCLREQGFIMQDAANDEWHSLYDSGRFLLRERYRDHTNRILDEFKFMSSQFEQDPQNKAFGEAVQKLFLDLGNDADGKPQFKPHLIKDLSQVIIPAIFEHVRYVPIPRIEVSDPMVDAVVENLVIESDNLMPNALEFSTDNYFRWGRKKISNKRHNAVMISATGVQLDLRDVSYYVKRKQGFPSLTDTGIMDVILSGDGFSFKIAASTAHKKDRQHFAKVDKVTVNIKNLDIKIKKSNHKLLFGIAKPILLKVMRPAITKVLEKQIAESFTKGDAQLWAIHQEAQKAIEAAKQDPENAPSLYQQYVSAVQRDVAQRRAKAEKIVSNTKVNTAVTTQDSIFQNIKLEGSISSKATEFKDLAAKGEKWESPVFSIGSANESTDIPKLAAVGRKPHNTAPSSVRGTGTGASPSSDVNGYPTEGFTNQVDQAFDSGDVKGGLGLGGGKQA
ncbi:MAG: hypothetical protein Q9227_002759 [Pyrenula ochraceoflavens]